MRLISFLHARLRSRVILGIVLSALALIAVPVTNASSRETPVSQQGQVIKVGFWYLRSLSSTSRSHPDLKQIAQAIRDFDCVALGAVYDDLVLGKLVNELSVLGGQWNKVKSPKRIGMRLFTGERYGILYRSDRVDVHGVTAVLDEKFLCVRGVPYRHPFDHQPFVSSFQTLDGRLDFALMVVNITEGPDPSSAMGKIPLRRKPFRDAEVAAVRSYFADFLAANAGERDLILCGNFRRDRLDPESPGGLLALPGMIDTTSPDVPTVLGSTNTYDHCLFQTNSVREYTGEHGVVKFEEMLFGGDLARAQQACSAHRPIWISLRVPERDDD